MANNQNTFIQLPMDVTNPWELRRFLDKLVQQVDVAFGKRGPGGFAADATLAEVIAILNDHEVRISNNETNIVDLLAEVQDLKDGELIVNTTVDIILGSATETILCDCSSNAIEVKLPNPVDSFNNSRSKTVSISKIDTTRNKVKIFPYASESVVGETYIELLMETEIINLITDGVNWHLGA